MRTRMARSLLSDCLYYGATLHAYVVMPHHVHFVATLPEDRDDSWFVQRIKTNSAKALMPLLLDEERAGFAEQEGLNLRSFWMRSFRGLPLLSEGIFHQKVYYTHQNPVRAGYAETFEAYPWSSAAVYGERLTEREAFRCVAEDCLARPPVLP